MAEERKAIFILSLNWVKDGDTYEHFPRTEGYQPYTSVDQARYAAETSKAWRMGMRWDDTGTGTNMVKDYYFSIEELETDKPFTEY